MTPSARFIAASFALALTTATHATDVGVSISVSQPGVYGRIDIGRYPQPVLVQSQPIIIQRGPRLIEPVYLWVPPGHQKNWRKHCGRYKRLWRAGVLRARRLVPRADGARALRAP